MTEQRHLTWVAAVATFLTALSLTTLLREQTWVLPAVAAMTLIAAIGFGGRRLGLPVAVIVLGQLLLTALLFCYQFGGADTRWWGLPTLDTLRRLGSLASGGQASIQQFAAPIRPDDGVTFLIVAGVAVIAIVVDMLAVGLRVVPAAGLPLLAVYTVPIAAAPDGVPWYLFAAAAAGFIGLLIADGRERLRRWGRTMGFSAADSEIQYVGDVSTSPVARVGRRVGVAAVGLAVILPAALPAMNGSLLGGGSGIGGSGGRSVITSDPIVDLNRDLRQSDDVALFTYTTNDPSPDYWRAVTLDQFDGNEWSQTDRKIPDEQIATEGMPKAPGIATRLNATLVTSHVEVLKTLDWRWLPAPYPMESIDTTGRWVYDSATLNIFGVSRTTAGLGYEVKSWRIAYDPAVVGTSIPSFARSDLALPSNLPAEVKTLAAQVTADAQTKYEKAIALQEWFRDPRQFTYTLEQDPGHSSSKLLDFLEDRRGYCEQFAATMAVMARSLGIPARVDVGFTPGAQTSPGNWTVTAHDAHAWPELYFEGLGWVRFEPTPGARTGNPPAWTDPIAPPPGGGPSTSATPTTSSTSTAGAQNPDDRLQGLGLDQGGSSGGFHFPTQAVLIAALVLLVAFLPRLIRFGWTRLRWRRARTDRDLVLAGWGQLLDDAGDLGFEWDQSDTPRMIAASIRAEAGLLGDPADALTRLATATERVLFARDIGTAPAVREDVRLAVGAMRNSVERSDRLRAFLFPRSTGRVWRAVVDGGADALDWLESLGTRLRLGRSTAG